MSDEGTTIPGLSIPQERIVDFCRRWTITELSLFGSALREDFGPESDIDLLVTFASGTSWRFDDLLDMKEELERVFGRRVDLIERKLVEFNENYIRRRHILGNLVTIYRTGMGPGP